jgi:hypothetical protein
MNTRLDDAAALCIWTIKALADYETERTTTSPGAAAAAAAAAAASTAAAAATAAGAAPTATGAAPAGTGTAAAADAPTGPTTISVFRDVAYYFWLVAMDQVKSAELQVNMSSPRATTWISANQARVFGIASIPGFQPPNGHPPAGRDAHLSQTLAHLDGTLGKLATETELSRTYKERTTIDKDRAITRFGNLPSWTRMMILRASEDPPQDATDSNGDPQPWRSLPVETYSDILKLTTVGSCKLALDHLLNDNMQCATNIPMSTCQAIHTGTLRWSNPDFPQAFSLFACPYAGAMHNGAALDQEAQELLLKATEGKGLSDLDVQKATKILLYSPKDIDIAARMIGVFACLLSCIAGSNSVMVGAVNGWITHIRANQLAYDHLTRADLLFPTKVCWLIDKSIQLFLGYCANATRTSLVSNNIICFDQAQQQIVLGTFTMNGVPPILSNQLQRSRQHLPSSSSGGGIGNGNRNHGGDQRPSSGGKRNGERQEYDPRGRPISNQHQNPKWKVTESREYTYVLKKFRDAPMCWGPGNPACANYWIRGVCREHCPREASHQPLGDHKNKFHEFILKIRENYQEECMP